MSLFVIADLHLSLTSDHPMDIFPGWENYTERIRDNWLMLVKPEDTVVIPGDISWGMSLDAAKEDLAFINALPGRKIIGKGNHDYWWETVGKMTRFFEANGFDTLSILHNNCYAYENIGICGTRGWVNDNSEAADAKVIAREVQRLDVSITAAENMGLEPVVFLHYPPFFGTERADDIVEVLHRHNIKRCYYGHVHGRAHSRAVTGLTECIDLRMISADHLKFIPYKIM
ncbi:MAG: metallophosphoesterase [Oscillospiraceae bacterium]|nr:metallophosphoesterase [Oscillospiraceae bacterium]